jgi:nucleotide-binding universal stress UspA family protein
MSMAEGAPAQGRHRTKLLVVVDDTPECRVALRYASLRAKRTGGAVTLLRVLEPADASHWLAIGKLMEEEAREEAEALLHALAAEVNEWAGVLPEYRIRQGRKLDEVLALLAEDPDIRALVLGASTSADGPGPLVLRLAGQMSGSLRVPVTVVPGNLSTEQLEEFA